MKAENPSLDRIHQLHNELELTQSVHVPGIRKALDYIKIGTQHALILEFVDGQTLKEAFVNQRRSLQDILKLAIALARRLDALHQRHIIHKDINPHNILVDPGSLSPTLIDFGIATQLDLKTSHLSSPEHLEGTLPYMSPEQTGRINRHIDYRTDFYALGITLYEMLTGHLPFEASDALGWVHAHLAAKPTPIREHNADIPLVLGAIVDKLMAKNPEDRYQSAHGLHHDLQACESQWQASGGIVPFELGQQDESAQFKVPEKLYGREREIECLMAGLDRVCQGSTELALISGFSGIGKSSIIDELIEPVTRRRAFFVSGKFDQFHRDIPYAPLLEAFRGLLRQVLAGSDEQIHAWRQRLMEAVGSNGQVLIDLLPEAELILGAQPSVPDLDAEQNRDRFQWVLENVVRAMAQPEHPLVIFLDDLQWADSATLSLLKSWLATGGIGFLYLLGAYRDNEVGDGHPLQRMLDEIEQADVAPIGLQIEPLAVDDVAHLLADMFKRTPDKVRPLAGLLRQRTSGNPFFLKAFLTHLHTDGTIVFNHRERGWTWDAARIQQHEMAENIVDFMVDKIQRLSQAAQQTLEIAACMGDRFTLPVLAGLSPCSARTIYDHLYDSIAQGLIVPLSALIRTEGDEIPELDYAFAHDRIRQAAYALVPETEKPVIHRQIGDILTRQLSEAQQEERLFDIVNHLNLGFADSAPNDAGEATALASQLSHWNLRAGQKALASVAYGPAMTYFRLGLNRLPHVAWQSDYDLTLALHTCMVESAYLERFAKLIM
ncbi:MAG: hypothetical protein ETSY1_09975 [Candidatus Entotheonella factor]|uniref:Protein kinase domain-containing protein n=1 Tax=Entotheonella factor TaxID=1429438 RepID=W4LSP3_ENTF1|nr:MAG: hypothetical protein ETSY1_09975 [Candidatus Entotheonella factor]